MSKLAYEIIESVYTDLSKMGTVRTTDQFSTQMLGMNKSYLRTIRAKGTNPSAKVLACCSNRLHRLSHTLNATRDPKAKPWADRISQLANDCAQQIFSVE